MNQTHPWRFQAVHEPPQPLSQNPNSVRFEKDVKQILDELGAEANSLIRKYVRDGLIKDGYIPDIPDQGIEATRQNSHD